MKLKHVSVVILALSVASTSFAETAAQRAIKQAQEKAAQAQAEEKPKEEPEAKAKAQAQVKPKPTATPKKK